MALPEEIKKLKKERISDSYEAREIQKLQDNIAEKDEQIERILKALEERMTEGGI